LPVGTVSNFFMNARRRPRVKWQDDIHRAVMDDDSTTNSGSDAFWWLSCLASLLIS